MSSRRIGCVVGPAVALLVPVSAAEPAAAAVPAGTPLEQLIPSGENFDKAAMVTDKSFGEKP